MEDIQLIVNTMKDALLRRLGDEVELVFQYGSHVKGTTHQYSDVDVSYVPVHETTWECITVIVGETLFDLYPMHWSHLERMAEFLDVSSTVLLHNRIVYSRTDAAALRFQALAAKLEASQQSEARPEMLRRAQEIFQSTGYDYYLLRLEAAAGHQSSCLRQAQIILRSVLHCLAVCNQAPVDTRKLEQVLALPRLPASFAATARRLVDAFEPQELLGAAEALLEATRKLLLAEQRQVLREEATFPEVFDSGYPELKRDLQGVMQACERQDMFALKTSLLSLLHEMSRGVAQATTGVAYSGFNSLADYEQDLVALGFPALLPLVAAGDFAELHRQCLVFDRRLREFLTRHAVELNDFATLDELRKHLEGETTGSAMVELKL